MPELRTAQDFREVPTRTIAAAGAQFACRDLCPRAGVPLVLLARLGANLDNWGPRIRDGLAQDRRVITVDYRGVGDSTGTVRNSTEATAADMVTVTRPVLTVHGDSGRMVPPQIRKQAKKLGVTYEFLFMRASGDQLRQITALVDQGVLRPVVGRVFSFDQTPQALQSLFQGGIRGKTVITANS